MAQTICRGLPPFYISINKKEWNFIETVEDLRFIPGVLRRALPIQDYAAIGDGRSIALLGRDGTAAWWCVPNMDSNPLFDSLLDGSSGNTFSIQPSEFFHAEQAYRKDSNVLETTFTTKNGVVRVTDSMNSTLAGRLPWSEFARRIEGVRGTVTMKIALVCGTAADRASRRPARLNGGGTRFQAGSVSGSFLATDNVTVWVNATMDFAGETVLEEGDRAVVAIVAVEDQPLGIPTIGDIDHRIDQSHQAWRAWAEGLSYSGPHAAAVTRSALILKLLLFSPSGAIAAAATTSLPERLGGNKNYDYRYAWVRDASYTLHAFLWLGQVPESQAAIAWLLQQLGIEGPRVCFRLEGGPVPPVRELPYPGYCDSLPVVVGNAAGAQRQHAIYGDIFEAAALFVARGNVLDRRSTLVLANLADECAGRWQQPDSGMWELQELRHYTMSKVSAWQALNRAIELADKSVLPSEKVPHWYLERGRIETWINNHCWSEELASYTFYPGTDRLDASLVLGIRFAFPATERLSTTCDAIRKNLSRGPWIYRYSGAEKEEGAFLACTFWLAEAYATLGRQEEAADLIDQALEGLPPGSGLLSEMIDPATGNLLGNLPQGLSHLALVHAVMLLK